MQAGFGSTGKFFAYEHYGIVPDLVCLGKGISSSLPLSAVIGKSKIMNLYGPGEMTSTHTGNPICCAAALANIDVLLGEKLTENAAKMGDILHKSLDGMKKKYSDVIGAHHGKGLVGGLHMVKPGTKDPDGDLAFEIVNKCFAEGPPHVRSGRLRQRDRQDRPAPHHQRRSLREGLASSSSPSPNASPLPASN